MNKFFEFDYYKQKLWEKYQSCSDGTAEMEEKMKERFNHSIGVVDMAIELIRIHNLPIDEEKAKICAILHDYAKYCSMEEFQSIKEEFNLDVEVIPEYKKVLHALLGGYIVKKELGIDDEDILKAIETHSTANSNMSPLQEIIYLADCVEAGRSGEYFANIRKIARKNYKKAIAIFLRDCIERILSDKTKNLHPYTLNAFEEYKKYLLSGENKYEQVLSALDHNLIKDVKVYDVRNSSPYFEYIIVATTASSRQMQACVNYLKDDFDIRGAEIGDAWSLIDLNDIIVHIFKEEERERYGIDRLYASYPVVK